MGYIVLVRHGESEANVKSILASRTGDYHLTENGIEHANNAAKVLKGLPVSCIYSSPVRRALETAEIIRKEFGDIRITVSESIHETDFGRSEGKYFQGRISDLTDKERLDMDIESWTSHVSRMKDFISSLDDNAIVVSHGFLIKAYISDLIGLRSDEAYGINIRFGSISIVVPEESRVYAVGSYSLSEATRRKLQ